MAEKQKIRTLVVDDERPARSELIYLLEKIDEIVICGEASSAAEAMIKVMELAPQLVFVDIQMEPVNGIILAKQLAKLEKPPYIVFATAYDKYAVEAFEINALDYVLKPFSEERIKTTIERITDEFKNNNPKENDTYKFLAILEKMTEREKKCFEKIPVWKGDRIILLCPEEIVFVTTTEGKNTIIKTIKGDYEANYSIGELEEKLPNDRFFKPHRSYIINLNHIKEVQPWFHNTYQLMMSHYENEKIPVSRNLVKDFKKAINIR